MRILFFSFKGGVGKTTLATQFAIDNDYGIITNEQGLLMNVFGEDRLVVVKDSEDIPDYGENWDIVYDFGGFYDQRLQHVLSFVDMVVVPTKIDMLSLDKLVETLVMIKDFNVKVVVVANMVQPGTLKQVNIINQLAAENDCNIDKICIVRTTSANDYLFSKGLTHIQRAQIDPLFSNSGKGIVADHKNLNATILSLRP